MVKPRTCRRCDGKGFIAAVAHVNMGRCIACGGAGEVETDAATIAATKAYAEARRALGAAAFAAGHEAHSGLSALEVNAPARLRAAVAAFAAGRDDVVPALITYYRAL
jgi:hypothetical protein